MASTAASSLKSFPFGSASAQAGAVRRGQISSEALLDAYLERIDQFNPALNALVVDDRKAALQRARAADKALARGEVWGPLHGLPMTVKESFDLAGYPTTWGQPERRDHVASRDALLVQRLKAAGAIIFGKSNVPLNLADFQSYNDVYGTANNPWDTSRIPGGSSGGSAALVAAGLSALEYGSDIGGSIRNPAAYCGVYGHKSTWGIVPKRGHALIERPAAEGDLSVIGPLARSAADLALALRLTVGPDDLSANGVQYRLPPPPRALAGQRIAVWLHEDSAPVDDCVKERIEAAARALGEAGAILDFKARPAFDALAAQETYLKLLQSNMATRRADYPKLVAARQQLADDDASPHAIALRRATASFKEFLEANQEREDLRWAWHDFFARYDFVLAPIIATPAFRHDHSEPMPARTMRINGVDEPYFSQVFWAGLATASYLPATIAPAGLSPEGLPIGIQIIGPAYGDRSTIWLAAQLARLIGGYTPPPGY